MSIPLRCNHCGLKFVSPLFNFVGAGSVTFSGCRTNCPRCQGSIEIPDATYRMVGRVLQAVYTPGVRRHDILAFQAVAKAVEAGEKTKQEADTEIAELNSALAALWNWANDNGAALSLIVTIIALWVAIAAKSSSDASGVQAHLDAVAQTEVQQKIYEALQQQNAPAKPQVVPARPMPQMMQGAQPRKPIPVTCQNRHERRKAARLAKRHPRV